MTDDREFDRILEDGLSDLPLPEAEVLEVTPWKKAMNRVIWGIGLTTLTLNIWYLQYLLPAVGVVLMLLGARLLRRENGWFRAFWLISLYNGVRMSCLLVLSATLWRSPGSLVWLHMGITLVQFLCLWQGVKAVRRKAGQPDQAGAAGALVLWYLVLGVMALLRVQGALLIWPMIVVYLFLLHSLSKLPALLDGAGYAVKPAPVRAPDWTVWVSWIAVLALCIPLAGVHFGRYHLDWTPVERSEQAELEEIRTDLRKLGFWKPILDDLPEEELRRCAGAVDVALHTAKESWCIWRAPNPEPEVTAVVVRLSKEDFRVIHYFRWPEDPPVRGMDAVELWPPSWEDYGAEITWGNVDGLVLCERDGVAYQAPFLGLEGRTTERDDLFFGHSTQNGIYGELTYPVDGENCRGYVSYDFHVPTELWGGKDIPEEDRWHIVSCWLNYVHQRSWINYPAISGLEYYLSGGLRDETFDRAQYDELFELSPSGVEPH